MGWEQNCCGVFLTQLQECFFNGSFSVFLFLTETIFIQFTDKTILAHQNKASFTSLEKTQAEEKASQPKGLVWHTYTSICSPGFIYNI